ncbi:uncharacterized protein LOC143177027 isoform X3 [Calliopsis andreniformis]|uniref:uncharacterized protein LOC143177027 isoform X3 n=1 Tax=Calliopsis andreniformis TaxID=337506 RepID=UPI003FCCE6AF
MIDLTVKTLDSQNHAFSLEDDQITVRGFKEHIADSVAVPADSQRLIYCGRVLQDEKKLKDYDVNGKVIHLVQRAPPRPGQRRNDGGQSQSQNNAQNWQNPQRTHYRLTRTQVRGNAMYLGAMAVPAEFVEGHGLPVPQLSNSLSNSRLIVARRMLDRANGLMDRLDNPNCSLNPPPAENNQPPLAQEVQIQQLEPEQFNTEGRANVGARLAEALATAIATAYVTLLGGIGDEGSELGAGNDATDDNQSDAQQSQQTQQSQQSQPEPVSTSNNEGQSSDREFVSRAEGAEAGPVNNANSSQSDVQQTQQPQQSSSEQVSTSDNSGQSSERGFASRPRRTLCAGIIPEAVAANFMGMQVNNGTTNRGRSDEGAEARQANNANEENRSDAQQSQPSQSEQLPRPPQMAELLDRLSNTHDRLRPYLERYCVLMLADPSLPPGAGPEGVEENQRIVDGVSESLHYISHACHALSDIIVDMSQQPPRNLRCRPIIIQHSAILQPGIPIQVEAHISLHGRNANNNNSAEENGDNAGGSAQLETNEAGTEEGNQQAEAEAGTQQQAEQQEQSQSPFGTVFNLPNNVEVLMEVSPEGTMDAASGSEPSQAGENNNNNNNNSGRVGGATGTFPWGSAHPTDFIRNLMQSVAGHMVQGGGIGTTIAIPNSSTGGQPSVSLLDGNTNAGQSTQARSNVDTHPTTATQTRSTSRPHIFHQQTHPLGVGMSMGQGLDFDPFLPCNSHHVRRTSTTTSSTVTSTSQGTRTSQAPTTETQSQAQTATTSTTASNTSSTNTTTPVTTSQTPSANSQFANLLRQMVGGASNQASISINGNNADIAGSLGNIMQMLNNRNVHVGIIGGNRNGNVVEEALTLAELLLPFASFFSAQDLANEGNFFASLSIIILQNITSMDLLRLQIGNSEPIANLRRPLQEFFQNNFPQSTPAVLQEQVIERVFSNLGPHLQNLFMPEEETSSRNGLCVDICATVEAVLRRHANEILQLLFDSEVTDARFGQETINIVNNAGRQLCAVLRYSIRGGQAGLEAFVTRSMSLMLGRNPILRPWLFNTITGPYRAYLLHFAQPPDSEILPLLIYKNVPSQQSTVPSATAHQPSQTQPDAEPMETDVAEEKTSFEASSPDDGEEIPETFPGHEALPSDWLPIIARDGVRQRRQLQMQGMNGGVATFSDAYLGTLPTKRRKLIEQQKPRLLVSPTPNHSAIAASMERLVREGVSRAGVEEVEGAAVAVAVDPGVRRAFGQAIRDCLNPRRYGTPDFPDPLRFPNATKYFADQDKQPK